MSDLSSWLWSHPEDWISGVSDESTVRRLATTESDGIPDDLIVYLAPALLTAGDPALARRARQCMARSMESESVQRQAGLAVSAVLTAAEVPHVFFKGSDLRYRLYDDPTQRVSADIDLLIDPARRWVAIAELSRIGTQSRSTVQPFLEGQTHAVDLTFQGVNLDLHVTAVQLFRDYEMQRSVLDHRLAIEVDGRPWPVPDREHGVAICLVHIGRHEGAGEYIHFKHGLDVLLACRRWHDLDWARVGEIGRDWRLQRLAGAGLWSWEPAFGSSIPAEALATLDPGRLQRYLARRTRRLLATPRERARGSKRLSQLLRKWAFAETWEERRALLGELRRRVQSGKRV